MLDSWHDSILTIHYWHSTRSLRLADVPVPGVSVPILARASTPNYLLLAETIDHLPTLLADDRESRGLSVDQQAKAIGISADSVNSLGPRSRTSTTAACLRYLSTL